MIVDRLATRGRGLGAVVATVVALLLAIPATADAALSIVVSPASPRPGEPVTFSATGSCDQWCVSWGWKVGSSVTPLATGFGDPEEALYEDGFSRIGTFNVTLTYVKTGPAPLFIPSTVTVVKQVTVVDNRPPAASFTVAPASATIGQTVTFTDTSTDPDGDTLTREWDTDGDGLFDDGTGATATRAFATAGAKTVRVRVTDSLGLSATTSRTVTVGNASPSVTLTVNPTTVATGSPVTFSAAATDPDGGPVTYAWDLTGNGAYTDSTAAAPPARSYARAGTVTVGVRVTDDDGAGASSTVQRTQVITVTNRVPTTPTITSAPAQVFRGDTVTLTAAATDPEGTALTYAWDLDGDGAFDDASGATASRAMPSSGTLSAKVRATDADGGTRDSAPFTVTAANRVPVASFTASSSAPAIGATVTFTDTSTDGDGQALTRAWDTDGDGAFDDGTGATATRAYATDGVKTVRLRVSDGEDTATATRTITVGNLSPTVTLTVSPQSAPTGTPVSFSASATDPDGGAVTYAWELDGDGDFDDATVATPPAQQYPRAGSRTVGVRVTDDDGAGPSSTVERTATVTATNRLPSLPAITAIPAAPRPGAQFALGAAATDPEGTALTYAWDLDGDGAFDDGTGATVDTTFPATGDLVVRVRATDADGGATTSDPLTLAGAPSAEPAPPVAPVPEPAPVVLAAGAPFTAAPVPAAAVPAPAPAGATTTPGATKTEKTKKKTSKPKRLRPFPRVRIKGRITRRGARFTRLTVTAPKGSRVEVTCKGRGCPRRYVKTTGTRGVVRLSRFLRSYRSGTRIIVRVTRSGSIGKYTSIVVRRRRAPQRSDRCLRPGSTRPTRCPAN